jgi:hypothetical protein
VWGGERRVPEPLEVEVERIGIVMFCLLETATATDVSADDFEALL